ncbi:unnamed protein product [Amoebophrya sp. A25]|nr:unnamed protein product [Amoebophrya sp. A25]|eukprot:GSA25T00027598001.1
MLPVAPGLSPEEVASRPGVTAFANSLPDYGNPASLFIPTTLLGEPVPHDPDLSIPNLPLEPEAAEKQQREVIERVLDKLTRKFLHKVFPPGAEVNNRDSLYMGRAGCALLCLKNKSYFLGHDYFMSELVDKLHYRHLDQAISDFLTPSITWGQDRKERSSLWTGSMGLRFARLYHKWVLETDTPVTTGTAQDDVDLNLMEENVNWMEYLPGEGEGFLCGRAGYLRALLWLLSACRYPKTEERLLSMIRTNALAMIESLTKYAHENQYETTCIPSSTVFVSLPLRCQQLTETTNTLLIKQGDVGGSMGLMGIFYVLLLIVREWNKRELEVLEWQEEILDALRFLETKENIWNGYPENLSDEWGGGRFTENTFNNGATAAVWLYNLAYEVYGRDSFKETAERAAEHAWQKALTIAEIGVDEIRKSPALSIALVQYDADGQKAKRAKLHGTGRHEESSEQFSSKMRSGHSTSVSGMGAYNNSSPIPPLPPRVTSRHRTQRETQHVQSPSGRTTHAPKEQYDDDPQSDEEERKDFRIYGINVKDKRGRTSGRQAQVKGFLLPLKGESKKIVSPFGKRAKSEEDEMPMSVSHPDKMGILHDDYFKSTRSVYSDTRSWLSHEPLVLSAKTGRSVATRPFLINHGKGPLARIDNVRNVSTWDGGVLRLGEQQSMFQPELTKRVLDHSLFSGAAGNGYAMLKMAKSSDPDADKWLFRARQLAYVMCDQAERDIDSLGAVDFQLGEGFAGLMSFLIDVLNPHSVEAKFPLFE